MKIGVLTEEPKNEDVALALKTEGEGLGHNVEILDLNECAVVNADETIVLYRGEPITGFDAMLVRGSENKLQFRLGIIECLEKLGVKVFNSAEAIRVCDNKFATQIALHKAGIKTPKSVIVSNIDQLESSVKYLGEEYPKIVKTSSGSHGVGVIKVESFESLKSIVQYLIAKNTDIIIQEFIPHKESGRIMVLKDRVLAAVMRTIPEKDFRSNMDQGAELKAHKSDEEENKLAIKVAEVLGCQITAIDYIKAEDGTLVVFEANSSPGFKGIQSVNEDVNIAKEVILHISSELQLPDAPEKVSSEAKEETQQDEKPVDVESSEISNQKEVTIHQTDDDVTDKGDETVNLEEIIVIKQINGDKPFSGKVDTGADRCSLHGENIEIGDNYVRFTLDNIRYKVALERIVKVISANGMERRPVVKLNVVFNEQSYTGVEFNISDRTGMKFPVIIGKNLLSAAGVLVNPQ